MEHLEKLSVNLGVNTTDIISQTFYNALVLSAGYLSVGLCFSIMCEKDLWFTGDYCSQACALSFVLCNLNFFMFSFRGQVINKSDEIYCRKVTFLSII